MNKLDAVEARILGSLIEKCFLTPEQYPLSFNALINACNQKTSREPVMELDATAVGKALKGLQDRGLAAQRFGSRVPKFAHHAEHLEIGDSTEILAVLGVLLLRGAQTAAELRVRTERMAHFTSNEQIEAVLQKLADHPQGPYVARLSRGRFQQLLCGDAPPPEPAYVPPTAARTEPPSEDRLAKLEERVAALEALWRELPERSGRTV